ncbi:hypothetical protein EfsSVR2332_25210 [Enterococcus faecalis]|uniref:Uncharacterized protein n=1 Tax=Enterococcus faecalis TaxID=1351 RepID=A0AC59HRY2_ENTFL|nr:hypothetical protein EfsSVR2332_25210 [Enterococcus faecalis]
MKQTELLKGILEGLVLAIIQRKETYGYEITKILNDQGFTEIVEGTVYTILLRLEKNQWVIAEKKAFRKRTNAEVLSLNLIRRSRTR